MFAILVLSIPTDPSPFPEASCASVLNLQNERGKKNLLGSLIEFLYKSALLLLVYGHEENTSPHPKCTAAKSAKGDECWESVGGAFPALGKAAEGGRAPRARTGCASQRLLQTMGKWTQQDTLTLLVGELTATWWRIKWVKSSDFISFKECTLHFRSFLFWLFQSVDP